MDSFFGIGIAELFFIAIIALVVLGPERLPGAIREVMKVIRQVRSLTTDLTSQFSEEMKAFDDINPQNILRELTEDPAEKKAAAAKAAAAKPPAKPAAKPTPKPAAKPTVKSTPKTVAKTGIGTANIAPKPPATDKAASDIATSEIAATDTTATDTTITDTNDVSPPEPAAGVGPVAESTADVAPAALPAAEALPAEQAEPSILPPARAADEAVHEPVGEETRAAAPDAVEPVVSVKQSAGEGDA
jgi:sec-independent protein translocase protein TatB